MEIAFDVWERSVSQTGTARFPFTVVGAVDPAGSLSLRVEPIAPRRAIVARVRVVRSSPDGARHELTVRARRRQRMPAGTHVFRVTAHARDGVALAAADAVLKVVPCVRVEEPAFAADLRDDAVMMRLELSSRCGCTVACAVRASYGDHTIEGPRALAVDLRTVHAELRIPLDARPFTPAELLVEVMCDDGTVIRRQPGRQPTVSWARPALSRAPLRGRLARMGTAAGAAAGMPLPPH